MRFGEVRKTRLGFDVTSGAIRLSGGRLQVLAANPGTAYWNNEVFNKLD